MKQHYVPEVYLRLFANDKGNFFQLNLDWKKIKEMNVSAVCYKENFYDVSDSLLKNQFQIGDERFLEKNAFGYENILVHVLSIFKDNPSILTNDYVIGLINIYLKLKQRNPYYTKVLTDEKLEEVYKSALIGLKSDIKKHPILKNIEFDVDKYASEIFKQERSDPDKLRKSQLRSILDALRNDSPSYQESIEQLFMMNFTVLNAGEGDFFIVSDNPGFTLKWMDSEGKRAGVYNIDLSNFQQVFFPLNSKQALIFDQFNPDLPQKQFRFINYINAPSAQVDALNRASLFCTNGKIFCENKEYLLNFTKNL